MAKFPDYIIEDIRSGNDIVDIVSSYLPLKQRGSSYFGLCPFHNENSPSFSVNAVGQYYNCFGCNSGGNVYHFVMHMENLNFYEAVKFLADRINYKIPQIGTSHDNLQNKALYDIHIIAAKYFYEALMSKEGSLAREYLEKRRVTASIAKRFGLGYAPKTSGLASLILRKFKTEDAISSGLISRSANGNLYDRFRNRLMFPIFSVSGQVVAFGGRELGEGDIKYLNSPTTNIFDKSKILYGLNFSKKAQKNLQNKNTNFVDWTRPILVEGYMDVITMQSQGFYNTMAAMGTSFTKEHLKTLVQTYNRDIKDIILFFDTDAAGIKAKIKTSTIFMQQDETVSHKIIELDNAKDPDEFIIKYGPIKLAEKINNAQDGILFQVKQMEKAYDITEPSERSHFLSTAMKFASNIKNEMSYESYIKTISKLYDISIKTLKKYAYRPETTEQEAIKSQDILLQGPGKGLEEAKPHIISIMLEIPQLITQISSNLSCDEICIGENAEIYKKFYSIILGKFVENKANTSSMLAGNILNDETLTNEERNKFTKILSYTHNYPTETKIKAINDNIKTIKKEFINKNLAIAGQKDDLQSIDELQKMLKSLENVIFVENI